MVQRHVVFDAHDLPSTASHTAIVVPELVSAIRMAVKLEIAHGAGTADHPRRTWGGGMLAGLGPCPTVGRRAGQRDVGGHGGIFAGGPAKGLADEMRCFSTRAPERSS